MGNAAKLRCREINWLGHSNCKLCSPKEDALFGGLDLSQFDHLSLPIEQLAVGSKGVLYSEGDPAHYLFMLRDGMVKLMQDAPSGGIRIVRVLGPGALVGLEALSGESYHHTAEALMTTQVCRIPKDTIRELGSRDGKLYGKLLEVAQTNIRQADTVITSLSTGSAQGRVARLLLDTLSKPDGNTCVALSREDMSAILSVTVETVSRIVAEFKRQGLVKEERGMMEFDRNGLQAAASL